ncbi:MAG: response regulator transcription factor [Granulosicoccus sp.]|nr:response regulator transcription factor [Granulosicoccus sp.]
MNKCAGSKRLRTAIVADDHELVRRSLIDILLEIPDTHVVAEAENGVKAISLVKQHKPDLLLLDAAMPMARGTEVFAEARRWSRDTRVAVVTGFTSVSLLSDWMTAGVNGLFLKTCTSSEMKKGFQVILEGGDYIAESIAEIIGTEESAIALTPREREVLAMIATGHNNAGIGECLSISVKTVEKHRASLMAKLGVHSVSELLIFALREGLLDEHKQL